jgi:MFS family permease
MLSHKSQSYFIVASGFGIQIFFVGTYNSFGLLIPQIEAELLWSRTAISGAASLMFFTTGVVGVLIGNLNDRFGPKRLMILAALVYGAGYSLVSTIQSPIELYLYYGLLAGIGLSVSDIIPLSTVARWFRKHRASTMGIVKIGAGVGQLFIPLLVAISLNNYGWRITSFLIGALSATFLIFLSVFLKRHPSRASTENGLTISDAEKDIFSERGASLKQVFHSRNFWILCIGQLIIFLCLMTVIVHIIPHATDKGLSPLIAAQILSTIGIASIVGRLIIGIIADRFGGTISLVFCYAVLVASFAIIYLFEAKWILFVFAMFYGFSHGGFFTLIAAIVAEMFGTKSHGAIFGVIQFSGAVGGMLGPLVAGLTFDITGSYQIVFLYSLILSLTGLILTGLLRSELKY